MLDVGKEVVMKKIKDSTVRQKRLLRAVAAAMDQVSREVI